jgi:uncharacterized membrane protein
VIAAGRTRAAAEMPSSQQGKGQPAKTGPAAVPAIDEPATAPTWLRISTLLLSLGGLGVSLYLTVAHYTTSMPVACPDTGVVNCEKVTTSPESVLFGVFPVAVLGLMFYLVMVTLNSPRAWRARLPVIRWARAGSLIAGIIFVLYLIYTELFALDAICPWCTSVHVITFLLFALTVPTLAGGPHIGGTAAAR